MVEDLGHILACLEEAFLSFFCLNSNLVSSLELVQVDFNLKACGSYYLLLVCNSIHCRLLLPR
jgi:hypothetical protein